MTTADLPLVNRYLDTLESHLVNLAAPERGEVIAELRQHIADALTAGRTIDQVLESLGPVDALARAYQLELLVSPRPSAPPQPRSDRWLRIAGLLAIGSLPTLIIVITLGSIGIAFTFSGVAVIIAGIAAMAGSLPSWATLTIEPWLAIVLGVVMTGLGIFSTGATLAYLRFVVRVVRRVVPARAPAAA